MSTAEAPGRGFRPTRGRPGSGRATGSWPCSSAPHSCCSQSGRLPDAQHVLSELLRPERRRVHRDRQLRDALPRRHAPHGDQEQLPLAPHRSSVRHGGRARIRRPARARALRDRVQGRGVHADGDLALRSGRDLAVHVREGSGAGDDQRGHRGREGRRLALGRPVRRAALDRGRTGRSAGGLVLERRSSRERGPARAHRDPRRRTYRRARAGSRARAAPGRHHGRRLERLQAGRRDGGRGRARASSGCPGVTVELRAESGSTVLETQTEANGTFAFEEVEAGSYLAAIGPDTFSEPYAGVSWLGEGLILPR